MSNLEIWLVIFLLLVATFLARSGFWLFGHHIKLPLRVQVALRYAPACALAAIIAPDLLLTGGRLDLSIDNPRLMAGILATAFFLVRKNMLQTIFFGMAVYTYVRLGL